MVKCHGYLWYECSNPNSVVDPVAEEATEHISLAMDFSCVNFVKQCHHDKSIEHHGEVNWGRISQTWNFHISAFHVIFHIHTKFMLVTKIFTVAETCDWHLG